MSTPTEAGGSSNGSQPQPVYLCQADEIFTVMVGQDVMSAYAWFAFVANVYYMPAAALFCLAGYLQLFVFSKHDAGSRFTRHARALCCWDCAVCLLCVAAHLPSFVLYGTLRHYGDVMAWYLFVLEPIGQAAMAGAQWQLLVLAVERCLVVSRPFKMRAVCDRLPIGRLFTVVFVLVMLLSVAQHLADFTVADCRDLHSGRTTVQLTRSFFFERNQWIKFGLKVLPFLVFRCPLPMLALLASTVVTVRHAYNRRSTRGPSTRLSVTLAMTNIKYILCNSAFFVNQLTELLWDSDQVEQPSFWTGFVVHLFVLEAHNILLVAHCATNWLIFYKSCRSPSRGHTFRRRAPPLLYENRQSSAVGACDDKRNPHPFKKTLTAAQPTLQQLAANWQQNTAQQQGFGRHILLLICAGNAALAQRAFGTSNADALCKNEQLAQQARLLTEYLDRLITSECCASESANVSGMCESLRGLGARHWRRGVRFRRADWVTIRSSLLHALTHTSQPLPPAQAQLQEQTARALTSFMLQQLRTGFICAQATALTERRDNAAESIRTLPAPAPVVVTSADYSQLKDKLTE